MTLTEAWENVSLDAMCRNVRRGNNGFVFILSLYTHTPFSPPQNKPKYPLGFRADAAGVEERAAVAFVSTPS